jgi:hypothetical protein
MEIIIAPASTARVISKKYIVPSAILEDIESTMPAPTTNKMGAVIIVILALNPPEIPAANK